ncbi:MAG TPA: two-component sensor histidine kinase [Actinobacteria bacterium]|nr:two-component sensor histidine kinase [Actinomycetota bacterium]
MASGAPLSSRLGLRQWMAIDAAVSVAMLTVLVGIAVSRHFHQSGGERTLALLLLAPFASLPLAVRRRWPVPVFLIVLAASVACTVLGARVSTVTGPAYALYTVAVQADRTWSLLALAAVEAAALVNGTEAGAGVNVALATTGKGNTVNAAFTALVNLTVWIAADSMRRRRAYSASLRERSLREALSGQRLQIARELHDIVAHAMSVVAVQAGVGSHLIATRPDEAAKSLRAIETTARAALSETRSLLSVIRDDDYDLASRSPVPGLDNLHVLVQRVTDAGQPVTLRVEGRPRPLPQSLELSLYRVVQEALTNVVKHAAPPATATVVIRYDDQGVVVEVTDDGHASGNKRSRGGGHGLAGMQERVSLLGGELSAGPRAGGGYQVLARLPAQAGAR